MSELKAHRIDNIISAYKIGKAFCMKTEEEVYLKSEADKVIADLEMKLAMAQQVLRLNKPEALFSNLDTMSRLSHEIDVVARRERNRKHKYCLAMAMWCFEKSYSTTLVKYDEKSGLLRNFYDWWGKLWLALATEPTWAKFLQLIRKEAK